MSIKLNGATSGSVELDVPDSVGSDLSITIPAAAGDIVVKGTDGSVDLGAIDIDSSGRVGVGTNSPGSYWAGVDNLVIADSGDAGLAIKSGTNNFGTISFTDTVSTANEGYIQYDHNLNSLKIGTNSTEQMRIDSSGNVGIGVTSMGGRFEVHTTANVQEPMRINDTNNTNGHTHRISFRTGNTEVGRITADRDDVLYVNNSDYRLKENISELAGAITRVKQLNPLRFSWKTAASNAATTDGFLAHEAQTVVPEAVTGTKDEVDDDGNPVHQGIDQSKLVPLLTAALQEAIAKIENLEASNAALETRLTALEGGS